MTRTLCRPPSSGRISDPVRSRENCPTPTLLMLRPSSLVRLQRRRRVSIRSLKKDHLRATLKLRVHSPFLGLTTLAILSQLTSSTRHLRDCLLPRLREERRVVDGRCTRRVRDFLLAKGLADVPVPDRVHVLVARLLLPPLRHLVALARSLPKMESRESGIAWIPFCGTRSPSSTLPCSRSECLVQN